MANITPMLTALCRTAAIHGRHRRGHVSESSAAPTAHSPPIPSAARKRQIRRCHQVWAKNDNPVKSGIGEDREVQAPGAADAVADASEEPAAQRPAHQERGLDDRAVAPTRSSRWSTSEQLRHEGRGHERIEVHVQAVEKPAQPGGDSRLPLVRRDLAQSRRFLAFGLGAAWGRGIDGRIGVLVHGTVLRGWHGRPRVV